MKKLLTVLLLVCVSFSSRAADSLTVKQIYEDAKAGFTSLVANLQGPAKHVYNVYVQQHKIEGICMLVVPMFLLLTGLSVLIGCLKKAQFKDYTWNVTATVSLFGFALCVGGILCTITFFTEGYFANIINPEYAAIQDIIKAFK